jgi:homoserine dehydrogenase
MKYKLAFIGFGTVGQGLAELLKEKASLLKQKYNLEYSAVAISDIKKGSVFQESGLDLNKILPLAKAEKSLEDYPSGQKGWDSLKTIAESNADIIVEATYSNFETGEPALSHFRKALERGKNVITTNKGPIALAYPELMNLAQKKGAFLRFEGTVMSGTPTLSLATEALAGAEISSIEGILNGTTNYILTNMEAGRSYDDVLKEAQELGYAEADPTADVEGWDALGKVVILANVLMGGNLKVSGCNRVGISNLSKKDIQQAKTEGKRWKLIASAQKTGAEVKAGVAPQKLSLEDPLAGISGVTNAIKFTTDTLGQVTMVGPGAGKKQTGFALLSDLLAIHRLKK